MRVQSVRSEWKLDFCGGKHFIQFEWLLWNVNTSLWYAWDSFAFYNIMCTMSICTFAYIRNVTLICLILGDFQLNSLHCAYGYSHKTKFVMVFCVLVNVFWKFKYNRMFIWIDTNNIPKLILEYLTFRMVFTYLLCIYFKIVFVDSGWTQ